MIDPDFGHWFAGFVDGEGCFLIGRTRSRTYFCRFEIGLRSDDQLILREIHQRLSIGKFNLNRNPYKNRVNTVAKFVVQDKSGCESLRNILLEYPLRAKKLRDFEIWSQAVDCWLSHNRGDSWEKIISLKGDLESGKLCRGVA